MPGGGEEWIFSGLYFTARWVGMGEFLCSYFIYYLPKALRGDEVGFYVSKEEPVGFLTD